VSRRILTSLLLVFLACSREVKKPATRSLVSDDSPQDGGTLVRRLEVDVHSLNPILVTNKYERGVMDYLFTPLVYLDQDLKPVAGLAKSWKVSDDSLVYTFDLDPKATFSDGTPVRPGDVVFTLRKIVDPASEAVQIVSEFEGLDMSRTRAVDDDTVDIAFKSPVAAQMLHFADLLVIPEHVYGAGDFRSAFDARVVGSGPYRFVRRDPGNQIVLDRREDFWMEHPHIKTVIFKIVGDHMTAWNALRRGDIDETYLTSDTWLRERNDPANLRHIDFQRFYALNYNFIAWNTRDPLLADARVRRALAMCVPIESIINGLYHGTARAMTGPFTPDMWAYNPTVPAIRFDPVEAKRLLASAGWLDTNADGVVDKDGRPLKFDLLVMSGNPTTAAFAQMVQAEAKKIGIDLGIVMMDGSTAIQRILAGNFQAAQMLWDLDPDPDIFALFHSSQIPPHGENVVFYSNPEVDRLLEQGRAELDQSKRKDIYWKVHEILARDQPYTWTVQVSAKWGVDKRVHGVKASRGYGLFGWYPGPFAWWIPRDMRTHDRTR
jgi:peptide/nickel transport system substrate-binding protein